MGMFDELRCNYPLPVEGMTGRVFQTKDTGSQSMDLYELREDGTLWHEDYDIEDRSDPNATGLDRFRGCMTRTNKRWLQETLTGEIRFYDFKTGRPDNSWIEFSAYFVDGKLRELHVIEDRD